MPPLASSCAAQASAALAAAVKDPYSVVQQEVGVVAERLRHSVGSTVPALEDAAKYFFKAGVVGKQLRPTLSLLMASALSTSAPADHLTVDTRPANEHAPELRRRQQRLAEISELIHVASLLHDDVIDEASTRRGISSLNAVVGNKRAILAGDFLLARASVSLAALRNSETVELMSEVLEHLVTGEIMQVGWASASSRPADGRHGRETAPHHSTRPTLPHARARAADRNV
jgi:geranyl diphosphate synthase